MEVLMFPKSHRIPVLLLALLLLLATVTFAQSKQGKFAADELVCRLAPGVTIDSLNTLFGTSVKGHLQQTDCYLLNIPTGQDPETLADLILGSALVTYCSPNFYLSIPEGLQRSSPFVDQEAIGTFELQPAASTLDLPEVYTLSTGVDVKVALIDGGVNFDHPVFADYDGDLVSAWDYVDDDAIATDEPGGWCSGHGTLVAGVIRLVAPDADIYVYRVLDTTGLGDGYHIAAAVLQAIDDGCKVINLSLGMIGIHDALDDALKAAHQDGVYIVASAGNDDTDIGATFPFPASRTYCHTVAALDSVNAKADFSNYGVKVDICAPGTQIYGPYLDSSYVWWDGTSFAAPFVSGGAAVIIGQRPSVTVDQLADIMGRTADNIDALNPDYIGMLGNGLVNVADALLTAQTLLNGDVNADGSLDIADLVNLVAFCFKDGEPVSAWADANCDNSIDIADICALVAYFYKESSTTCMSF